MYSDTSRNARAVKTFWRLRALLGTLLVLGCPWTVSLAIATPVAQPHAPALWVDFRDARLSIEATEALWVNVVNEVRRKTGLHLHVYVPLEGAVTVSVKDLPIEQALRHLFGPEANLAFRYPPAERRPATAPALPSDVWVLGRGPGNALDTPAEQGELATSVSADIDGPSEAASEERPADLEAFAEQGNEEALRQALFDPDQTIQARAFELLAKRDAREAIVVLGSVTKSDQPEMRLQGLQLFHQSAQVDDPTVVSVLSGALADEDAMVKGFAIQALADRGGTDAIGFLRQALRDPDASIRMLVLDSVIRMNLDLSLVQEALSDADAAVRAMALSHLEQSVLEGP